jgi:hypothetical protein
VDIWAAGILAYELLIGKPPFEVDDEAETRRRIIQETALALPGHVSAGAASFIRAALAKDAAARPSAAELLRHPWVAPHLAAVLASSAAGSASAPADGGRAAALAALRAAARPGAYATSAGGAPRAATSFNSCGAAPAAPAPHKPAGLTIALAQDLSSSLSFSSGGPAGSSASASAACGVGRGVLAAGSAGGPGSPCTPQPYQGGRKPIWEADRSPAGSTATSVRSSGLGASDGGAPSDGVGARSKLAPGGPGALPAAAPAGGAGSGGAGGGSNPLLKAALSSSLSKSAAAAAAAAAAGAGAGRIPAAPHSGSGARPGAGANVKARIKDYFVARSANEASVGGGTLT